MTNEQPAPEAALAEARARAEAAEARVASLQAEHARLMIRAELKAEAVRAGMVDLDGLKLLDLSDATLDDAGEVQGAAALMARLKAGKPWLFAPASSSATATPPPAAHAAARNARDMTEAEYRAARAELLKRRF